MAQYLPLSDIRAFTGYPSVPQRMFSLSLCTTPLTWDDQCQPAAKHKTRWDMSQHCPQTGHAWSPKHKLCNTCLFICTNTWREGVKQMDRASLFSVMPSDRTDSEAIGTNWNNECPPKHPKTWFLLWCWLSTGTGCLYYSQSIWTQPRASSCRWASLGRGLGPGNLQRSLLISAILRFRDT